MASFKNAAATLPTKDQARAQEFYGGTLGLKAEMMDDGGALYRVGDSVLLVYPSEFAGTNQATAASFEVDDLEGMMQELRGKGVAFEEYDIPGVKTENGIAEFGGDRGAWFKDPEGNIVALIQRGS